MPIVMSDWSEPVHFQVQALEYPASEIQKLIANDPQNGSIYGTSVAISGDGNTLFVARTGDNNYSHGLTNVYVYVRSGLSWVLQTKLTNVSRMNSERKRQLSSSYDGNTLLIAATLDGSNSQGAVYVYIRTGTVWSQQAKLFQATPVESGNFGVFTSISDDGNTALIGAVNGVDIFTIFKRTGSVWAKQAALTIDSPSTEKPGQVGAVSGDGNTVVFTANTKTSSLGLVYVFNWNGSSWIKDTTLIPTSDNRNGFGTSDICISFDGSFISVSNIMLNTVQGAVYIFNKNGSIWTQQTKLTVNQPINYEYFGESVDFNSDASLIIIGAKAVGSGFPGRAYIFSRVESTWEEETKLMASDGTNNNFFGCCVSISNNGNVAIVGASRDSSAEGAAYVFQ